MILNKFHIRQNSTATDTASRTSLHQRRDSYQCLTQQSGPTTQLYDEENTPPSTPTKASEPSWSNMPNKLQLLILALSRLVDFWQMASLQSYMVQQLRSFDVGLPDSTISHQAGILQGSFTAAQIVTSILWGRAADSPAVGRKNVLLVGLVGTGFSCIGVGFSSTFWQAAVWRLLGGAMNGTVGAARTMVAETVHKRWHSRAFLLLPVAFNVANILGPVVGGLLVDPVANYPSVFEGGDGYTMQSLKAYPYATPSLLCAVLLFLEAGLVVAFLNETLPSRNGVHTLYQQFKDMCEGIIAILRDQKRQPSQLSESDHQLYLLPKRVISEKVPAILSPSQPAQRLPFHRIWTSNVLWTLLSVAIFDFHMGAFSGLWIIFLSTSRSAAAQTTENLAKRTPINFTGGLGFKPALLGTSLAILGIVGLGLQILLYPWANGKFGLMRCFRCSLILFPLAYTLAPYLSLLPSTTRAPLPASGPLIWVAISLVLTLQVTARTFALPASIILVNNASPHPSVLGTIHGVGQSVSSAFRTLGPVAGGYWYGVGLDKGMIGLSWWAVAMISAFGCVASLWVQNGSGHEILLPGEEEGEGSHH